MNRLFAVRSQEFSQIAGRGEIFDQDLRPPVPIHADLRNVNLRCLVWREQYIIMRGVLFVEELVGCQMTPQVIASPGRDVDRPENLFILNIPAGHG
jgi:hypothetical protein